MNIKEKIKYFWNVTLGEDYPDDTNEIEDTELAAALNDSKGILEKIEKNYYDNSAKSGKEKITKVEKKPIIGQRGKNSDKSRVSINEGEESRAPIKEGNER